MFSLTGLPELTACLWPDRWEGRPRTPPFKWGEKGEVLPPHDMWLRELNLRREGLEVLVEVDLIRAGVWLQQLLEGRSGQVAVDRGIPERKPKGFHV